MLCFVLLLAAGCGVKKLLPTMHGKHPAALARLAPTPKISASIQFLMDLALEQGDMKRALAGLDRLVNEAASPLNEEARFRRVQLLLLVNDEQALVAARKLLAAYPNDALVPYLHIWMAQWAEAHQDDAGVLAQTAASLANPELTREIANRAAGLGAAAARRSPDRDAVRWFLETAHSSAYATGEARDGWLRDAAARASMVMIGRLRHEGRLRGQVGKAFYLDVARTRLMMGDMAAVQTLSAWLKEDFPHTDVAFRVATWAAGATHQVNIGLLLPLTGEYARFGGQALRGMRLALDSSQNHGKITLNIADTRSDPDQCIRAYQRLVNEGVTIILGPLIGDCAAAIAPYLHDNIPVISLTGHTNLAQRSPMLFVHTLAFPMQAAFMAARAWRQGDRRMVVIGADNPSSGREADAFVQAFEDLGGEIVDRFELPQQSIDFRSDLRAMRLRTDDEELLAELDEDLALSAQPENKMEIRMPVNFDAAYLALPGKQVALLAGQLAYVGVNGIQLYGSGRWRDGKLLSDRGRYLGRARFSNVAFPDGISAGLHRFMLAWRDIWGANQPGKLAGLAYDTTLIAAMLTSRLGLSGLDVLTGLHDAAGFSGLTGHVRFNQEGVGYTDFGLFRIRRGRIVPAG